MRNKTLYYVALLFLSFNAPIISQNLWLTPKIDGDKVLFYNQVTERPLNNDRHSFTLINYNAAANISDEVLINLEDKSYDQFQMFTIHKGQRNASEGAIWEMSQNGVDEVLMTNARIADQSKKKYINFFGRDPSLPQLTTYHHNQHNRSFTQLRVGGLPTDKAIPITYYTGSIGELILFDRILAPTAQKGLESALAIKYGIPLEQNVPYSDHMGNELFNTHKSDYSYNIGALGRSDVFGLNQKQSKTVLGTGFLAIGLEKIKERNDINPSTIAEQSYLFWADNGDDLSFSEVNGLPSKINRDWMVQNRGLGFGKKFDIKIHHNLLAHTLEEGEYYYIIVDTLSESLSKGMLYKLEEGDGSFDTNQVMFGQGVSYFSIVKAPTFWAQLSVNQAQCLEDHLGSITINPVGGSNPFNVQIKDQTGQVINKTFVESLTMELDGGSYSLILTDAEGQVYEDEVVVDFEEFPVAKWPSTCNIGDGTKSLDIATGFSDVSYQWTNPQGKVTHDSELLLDQIGQYRISVRKGDCEVIDYLEVVGNPSPFKYFSTSPNPSSDGRVFVKGLLDYESVYTIKVTDVLGETIAHSAFTQSQFIDHVLQLNQGVYFISLIVDDHIQTRKQIVLSQ